MITALLLLAAAIWIPGAILLVVHVRRAPVGFEDANGFHVISQAQDTKDAVLVPAALHTS